MQSLDEFDTGELSFRQVVRTFTRTYPFIRPVIRHLLAWIGASLIVFLWLVVTAFISVGVMFGSALGAVPVGEFNAAILDLDPAVYVNVERLSDAARLELRWPIVLIAILQVSVALVAGGLLYYYRMWIFQRINQNMRMGLIEQLQALSLRFHADSQIGDSIYRVYQDSSMVTEIIQALFVEPLMFISRYLFGVAVVAAFSPTFALLLGLTFLPMSLILVEPDLGSALLFLPTLFAMLIAAGAKLRHLALIIILGASMAPAMYPLLKSHQKDRINAMLAQVTGDKRYDDSTGFQQARAMTLVGAGRLTGSGRNKSAALVSHNRLPEDHNDMIFAVICTRWGVLGAVATWGLFGLLCGGGLLIASQCKDPFGRLLPVGIVSVLFAQMTINTGMTIGVIPITGMTLPFVSYGGSSLVSAWVMVGLLLNIAMRRSRYLAREAFEFDGVDEGR